ncbi:MAG: hypothetical protein AB2L22_06000 [Syntrophales bacterium]
MLNEEDVTQRAIYCYLAFRQMAILYSSNEMPSRYQEILGRSSLDLAEDPFIRETLEEALLEERVEEALHHLMILYEGLTLALCEVLETDMETIGESLPPSYLEQILDEMSPRPS